MNNVEHKVFICACESAGHQLIFSRFTWSDYEDQDVYLTAGLITDYPFFKRLWIALRYLFKLRSDPYQFEVILSPENTKALAASLMQEVQ
jgi:hypothetical protein